MTRSLILALVASATLTVAQPLYGGRRVVQPQAVRVAPQAMVPMMAPVAPVAAAPRPAFMNDAYIAWEEQYITALADDYYAQSQGPMFLTSQPIITAAQNGPQLGNLIASQSYSLRSDLSRDQLSRAVRSGADRGEIWALENELDSNNYNQQAFLLDSGLVGGNGDLSKMLFYMADSRDADNARQNLRNTLRNAEASGKEKYIADLEHRAARADANGKLYGILAPGNAQMEELALMVEYQGKQHEMEVAEMGLEDAERAFVADRSRSNALAVELAELNYEAVKSARISAMTGLITGAQLWADLGPFATAREERFKSKASELQLEIDTAKYFEENNVSPYAILDQQDNRGRGRRSSRGRRGSRRGGGLFGGW